MKVAIIGGGAAGFFSAINVKQNFPNAVVTMYEKTSKLLSKVKVSGGGRCNVCNACTDIDELSRNYPRGEKYLRKLFGYFATKETMEWFAKRGVPLVVQEDNCVFPKSQNSQTIIDCFMSEALKHNITIKLNHDFNGLEKKEKGMEIMFSNQNSANTDFVIITIGGQPKAEKLKWLQAIGHQIENPVPSLFTFNMPNESIKDLMGVVVNDVLVQVQSSNLKSDGILLITHWGMSGPAILKLSALGARFFNEKNYDFKIQINWLNNKDQDFVRNQIENHFKSGGNKNCINHRLVEIPQRLWEYLISKCGIPKDKTCNQINQKEVNKLCNQLCNDIYAVLGKTTFKEEFVTCGGVSFKDLNTKTLESKKIPGLFFAGEILDVDGITGGFNFQAAWTTAFVAAKLGQS